MGNIFNNENQQAIIVHPWARWLARIFDYQIVGFILAFIISLFAPEVLAIKFILLNMLLSFIYVFVESSFLVFWAQHLENFY